VLVWKRHDGGGGAGSAVDEYLAKVEKALRADPMLDRRAASELVMRDPDLVRRYGEDMHGWSGRPTVAKAAGPDSRAAIVRRWRTTTAPSWTAW
jgi:hypothetical protein